MSHVAPEVNQFEHSVWFGSRYRRGSRSFVLDAPALIFACPLCEYRWTADHQEAIDTIRATHVRSVHPEHVAELAALDIERATRLLDHWLPRHLRDG